MPSLHSPTLKHWTKLKRTNALAYFVKASLKKKDCFIKALFLMIPLFLRARVEQLPALLSPILKLWMKLKRTNALAYFVRASLTEK